MRPLLRWSRRLRALFWQPAPEQEVAVELDHHRALLERDLRAGGLSHTEARDEAGRRLGNQAAIVRACAEEAVRRNRGRAVRQSAQDLRQDVLLALRQFLRRPRLAVVAIGTLAVAIGASVGILTVIDHVLLRPLPYPASDRLVTVWNTYPSWRGREVLDAFWDRIGLSWPEYLALRDARSYDAVALYWMDERVLLEGEPEVVSVGFATHSLPAVLHVEPAQGRWFSPEEDRPGAGPVVVLTEEFWRGRFGADPALLGRTIRLGGEPHLVLGVLPSGFRFSSLRGTAPVAWTSLGRLSAGFDEGNHSFEGIARLGPGIAMAQALEETEGLLRGDRSPEVRGARVVSRQDEEVRTTRPTLVLLAGAAGLLLLLACANVATLLLTQVTERDHEIAVRFALGAGRGRIVRQLLAESGLLSLVGGAVGVAAAWATTGLLVSLIPSDAPAVASVRLDLRLLAMAAALSLATGLVFGTVPAWRYARRPVGQGLREERPAARSRTHGVLLTGQVAMALVLLVGAGLLTRTVIALSSVRPGFEADHRLTFRVELPARYDEGSGMAFFDALQTELAAEPGVRGIATTSVIPLSGDQTNNSVWVLSNGPEPEGPKPSAERRIVSPGYFGTMGMVLLAGRTFEAADRLTSPRVAIVSRTAVERFWQGRDPLRDRILLQNREWEVVGVVEDVRDGSLDLEPGPTVYVPAGQWPQASRNVVVRTTVPPEPLADAVQRAVAALDAEVPVRDLRTMNQIVARSTAAQRYRAALVGGIALLAALLALAGVYGVTAFLVARRTREIGVRLALGAGPGNILRLLVGGTLRFALAGILLGLVGAALLVRLLTRQIYGVQPFDPPTFVTVALLMLGVSALTAMLGARRATRIDPVEALREG